MYVSRSMNVRLFARTLNQQRPQQYQRYFTRGFGVSSQSSQSKAPKRPPFWNAFQKVILLVTAGGALIVANDIYTYNNPPIQSSPDPNKKTLVVLGTGWGSTAFLKGIDAAKYNVVVISPRNYFLFTPLLPSCVTGLLQTRSLIEPIRNVLRSKSTEVTFYEATATKIDCEKGIVHIQKKCNDSFREDVVEFDYLIHGIGSKTATFGIQGVEEHACFVKEVEDAQNLRKLLMSRVEEASLKGQSKEDIERLLHVVVVGGGPTGVEVAAEIQDFFNDDLQKLLPELRNHFKMTLVEALPTILPMFSKQLIEYAETTMQEESIKLLKRTMVKSVTDTIVEVQSAGADGSKRIDNIPYGLLVWAGGNAPHALTKDLMMQLPEQASSRRGILVNEFLQVKGTQNIWALGDCTSTANAPTAQVASQQGAYLAEYLNTRANVEEQFQGQERINIDEELTQSEQFPEFEYSHKGSLAYVGNERAIADLSLFQWSLPSAGASTLLIWRAAYIKMCISVRNQLFVLGDWTRARIFGRDVGNL